MGTLRRYFISGLLIWLPILATVVVIRFIFEVMDKSINLLPLAYQPKHLIGFDIPGLGLVLTVLVILITGLLVGNFIGRHVESFWDRLIARIPLVRTVYSSVKQVLVTLFSDQSQSFRKVLLVEFPHKDMWTIAFQSGADMKPEFTGLEEELITIYVPTTPNPTSGYLVMVPKKDVKELPISVEQGLKMVINLEL